MSIGKLSMFANSLAISLPSSKKTFGRVQNCIKIVMYLVKLQEQRAQGISGKRYSRKDSNALYGRSEKMRIESYDLELKTTLCLARETLPTADR